MAVLVDTSRGGKGAEAFEPLLRKKGKAFIKRLKLEDCELSVTLVGDAEIRKLNRTWRKKDKATDVLSFPAGDWPGPGPRPLGDVVISLATTRRAAKDYGHTVEQELTRYLAHGLLHLLGHDHLKKGEAARMQRAEAALLGGPGMLGSPCLPP